MDEFDFIILGGGSAGCVLANRLSADPRNRVCLIEAGGDDRHWKISTPIGILGLIHDAKFNWRAKTVAQADAGGREIFVPLGRVLGGSSSINGMVYMRGDAFDYDDWARAGNRGWNYREVLPYFLRAENNELWLDSSFHGVGGPLNVANLRACNPAARSFLEAAQCLGIPVSHDFSVPHPEGVGFRQVTQRHGRRESAATAYLRPAANRGNLMILTDALADRVILEGRKAVGVSIRQAGRVRELRVRREAIVCAGAVGSPAILQRSGIGDPAFLRSIGIDPVHGLPGVGANLQDHNTASVAYKTRSTVPYGLSLAGLPKLAFSVLQYAVARRGLLSSNASEVAAFVRTSPELDRADLQLSFVSGRRGTNIRAGNWGHGYGATAIQLRPWSRGSVKLRSCDPAVPPAIDLAAFADDRDLALMFKGMRLARSILQAESFARYEGIEVAPGRDTADGALGDYIRMSSGTAFHPVGTCAMGRHSGAVVDDSLAVRGIAGLRVVDASVMPTIIGGNTNAPVMMIAEKAADMILGHAPPPPVDVPGLAVPSAIPAQVCSVN